MPSHSFLNPIEGERFRPLAPAEVNVVLNRARVGLCLSAAEGAMFASMEYMLAGLPVVSTPNLGGRDFFFDPDYCLTVPANAGAVRAAVESLVARNIPASYIRSRTLARAERERGHFIELLRQAGRHRAPSVGREGPGRFLRRLLSLVPAGGAPARHPFRGLSKPPSDQPPASSANLAGSRTRRHDDPGATAPASVKKSTSITNLLVHGRVVSTDCRDSGPSAGPHGWAAGRRLHSLPTATHPSPLSPASPCASRRLPRSARASGTPCPAGGRVRGRFPHRTSPSSAGNRNAPGGARSCAPSPLP